MRWSASDAALAIGHLLLSALQCVLLRWIPVTTASQAQSLVAALTSHAREIGPAAQCTLTVVDALLLDVFTSCVLEVTLAKLLTVPPDAVFTFTVHVI